MSRPKGSRNRKGADSDSAIKLQNRALCEHNQRKCRQCGEVYDYSNFEIYRYNSDGTVGYKTICKKCEAYNARRALAGRLAARGMLDKL